MTQEIVYKTSEGGKIMKKNLAKKVTLSILAGAVLMSSSVVWAATPTGWEEISIGVLPNKLYQPGQHGGHPIDSGDYDVALAGVVRKGNSQESASNGNLIINGGTFSGFAVCGGSGYYEDSMAGQEYAKVDSNTITIDGGSFSPYNSSQGMYIIGGWASSQGIATNNEVIINDLSLVEANISGNNVKGIKEVVGGKATGMGNNQNLGVGEANNNTVIINGGIFQDVNDGNTDIIGGFGRKKAQGNTVTISGTANVEKARLFGGYLKLGTDTYGFDYKDNTLNIGTESTPWQATDTGKDGGTKIQNKVYRIDGFDVINFAYVNWDTNKPAVEVEKLTLNNTKIKVGTVNVASGTELANGDEMTLISVTANGTMTGSISNSGDVAVCEGIANVYNGYVSQDNTEKKIYLVLGDGPTGGETGGDNSGEGGNDTPTGGETGGDNSGEGGNTTPQPSRNDQVLVLGESRAAAIAFTNQGSELIETGLNALARDNEKDTKVFAAVYGNHSEYETGSHVNVNGWSGIVGIGKTNANGLTVGAFFENGEGNYSTHNIFTNDYIRGDGEACYNGGGFLVRKDNANGVYAEASLRAGNLQNELRNAVRNGSELTGYDIDTFYYGAHIGIGKVIARGNDGDSVDVYGKFIYTHHDGETFDIGGTTTKFDSVESERLRLGFRINEVQTNKLSMYYGVAWEYEFNGDAHDKIASFDLETPSLEGSTVIGELGAHYKASDKWSIDLNGRAYVGQREGFSGSVQANYAF